MEQNQSEQEAVNPYAHLSNRELAVAMLRAILSWFVGLFPLASEVPHSDRYVSFDVKERRSFRRDRETGKRKVLIGSARLPIVIVGRRIAWWGLIFAALILITLGTLIRLAIVAQS